MYIIKAENVYEDLYKQKYLFDFSSYPKESSYYDNANNLIVLKMNDETYDGLIYNKRWLPSYQKTDLHVKK